MPWEGETVGISEPLIEVIDVLFRMHSRGFIRPLVCACCLRPACQCAAAADGMSSCRCCAFSQPARVNARSVAPC